MPDNGPGYLRRLKDGRLLLRIQIQQPRGCEVAVVQDQPSASRIKGEVGRIAIEADSLHLCHRFKIVDMNGVIEAPDREATAIRGNVTTRAKGNVIEFKSDYRIGTRIS